MNVTSGLFLSAQNCLLLYKSIFLMTVSSKIAITPLHLSCGGVAQSVRAAES